MRIVMIKANNLTSHDNNHDWPIDWSMLAMGSKTPPYNSNNTSTLIYRMRYDNQRYRRDKMACNLLGCLSFHYHSCIKSRASMLYAKIWNHLSNLESTTRYCTTYGNKQKRMQLSKQLLHCIVLKRVEKVESTSGLYLQAGRNLNSEFQNFSHSIG